MPLYTYECKECKHKFDAVQSIANREVPCSEECPSCHAKDTVQKIMALNSNVVVSGVGDWRAKVPGWMKDKLKDIKTDSGKRCTIDV